VKGKAEGFGIPFRIVWDASNPGDAVPGFHTIHIKINERHSAEWRRKALELI